MYKKVMFLCTFTFFSLVTTWTHAMETSETLSLLSHLSHLEEQCNLVSALINQDSNQFLLLMTKEPNSKQTLQVLLSNLVVLVANQKISFSYFCTLMRTLKDIMSLNSWLKEKVRLEDALMAAIIRDQASIITFLVKEIGFNLQTFLVQVGSDKEGYTGYTLPAFAAREVKNSTIAYLLQELEQEQIREKVNVKS